VKGRWFLSTNRDKYWKNC